MTQSLFNRIYSYRERENKNSLENFLIEIFAFCLTEDKVFAKRYFSKFNVHLPENYIVKTQAVYDFGRPDIEIYFPDKKELILIECKIEHFERENQLDDYAKILNSQKLDKKHLFYLTKYYDYKELNQPNIDFQLQKWSDIYNLIDEKKDNETTKQLKLYIKELNMAESSNFNYQDLAVLKSIPASIRKMDEILDGIKPYFEKKIGGLSKESARSTRLKDSWYVNYHDIYNGKVLKYGVSVGFFWWDNDISLALRIWLPNKEKNTDTTNYKQIFDKHLKNWELEEWDDCYNYWYYDSVAQFIIDEKEQIPAMIEFLKKGIDELTELKNIDKKILG